MDLTGGYYRLAQMRLRLDLDHPAELPQTGSKVVTYNPQELNAFKSLDLKAF